mmetsp:Transcript_87929/g.175886  ORF Transcript_87929/g.175886 Transcript_87929/m.175886 type:complete len:479 (+) Transcript_87929:23-1459(+)
MGSSWFIAACVFLTPGCSLAMSLPASAVLPRLPLPAPLLSNQPGTWAHDTMSRRVREEILGREVLEANAEALSAPELEGCRQSLLALDQELAAAATTPLRHLLPHEEAVSPDAEAWRSTLSPLVERGATWLDAPWLVAEFYLYRRVMESLGFFTRPEAFFDPFLASKRKGLDSCMSSMEALAPSVLGALAAFGPRQQMASSAKEDKEAVDDADLGVSLRLFALISLWGNRMDLSLWPAGSKGNVADAFEQVLAAGEANLLSDDFSKLAEVAAKCRSQGGKRVDIIVDNAGFELVTDLLLADFLVTSGIASTVVFQLKAHPTFVSDARACDLEEHVNTLSGLNPETNPGCSELGARFRAHLSSGSWVLQEHLFWVQPGAMWEMPAGLRSELSEESALAFTKGDANYRRLLGDRQWALDAPFQGVCGYFPTVLCALRTLKAELGCGMGEHHTNRAAAEDEKWMVNGRYGVIQVAVPDELE